MRFVAVVLATTLTASTALAASPRPPSATPAPAAACDCLRFPEELAATRALFASRGEGVVSTRLTAAARERYRDRVLATYERARCLLACDGVPQPERNDTRALFAAAAFKSRSLGPTPAAVNERLQRGFEAVERCLADPPVAPACHLLHGSIRGTLARDSWTPWQLTLPKQLLADFRAARNGAPPGRDEPDGAATRAEASLLVHAPPFAGGDTREARRLMEQATTSPLYACTVDNRLLYAETLSRTGSPELAVAELRATLASGLPSCGDNRYENASDLDTVARCLARLESHPGNDPKWDANCR